MTKQFIIGGFIGAAVISFLAGVSLSWLLILACPLMMVFMHGGHQHGGHNDKVGRKSAQDDAPGHEHLAHRG